MCNIILCVCNICHGFFCVSLPKNLRVFICMQMKRQSLDNDNISLPSTAQYMNKDNIYILMKEYCPLVLRCRINFLFTKQTCKYTTRRQQTNTVIKRKSGRQYQFKTKIHRIKKVQLLLKSIINRSIYQRSKKKSQSCRLENKKDVDKGGIYNLPLI